VLVFHGTPDTGRVALTGADAAREVGVRLLSANRPGYGSSAAAACTHSSVARDAAEVLDLWGIDKVAVLGMSVGATFAAAFAATYPERTTALALVAAPAMALTETAGSIEDAMHRIRPGFLEWRATIAPDDRDDAAVAARFLATLPEADASLLRPLGAEPVAGLVRDAVLEPAGYLGDAALLLRRWDVDPADVRAPTTLWCGELDEKAMTASPWWLSKIPHADLRTARGTTHLATLLTQWPDILRSLRTTATSSADDENTCSI
jgi:pimeloyl-ACP methyl ester carboxylesterase